MLLLLHGSREIFLIQNMDATSPFVLGHMTELKFLNLKAWMCLHSSCSYFWLQRPFYIQSFIDSLAPSRTFYLNLKKEQQWRARFFCTATFEIRQIAPCFLYAQTSTIGILFSWTYFDTYKYELHMQNMAVSHSRNMAWMNNTRLLLTFQERPQQTRLICGIRKAKVNFSTLK